MKHALKAENLGDFELPIMDAVQKCVHCGFCLPTCPTYQVLGQEMDSPRGRILLMKEDLEGNLPSHEAATSIDHCLGCLACETACPSGVPYGHLLSAYRALERSSPHKQWTDRLTESMVHQTVPFPARFRWAARLGKLALPFAFLLPRFLQSMLELLPDESPAAEPLPEFPPATGEARGRVGLLAGCAQQVLAPQINRATISVLNKMGFDVVVPRQQSCCGGLDWHAGRVKSMRRMAKQNFTLFHEDVDCIVTNAAGCGSAIREYELAFRGTDDLAAASQFADRVVDISVFLVNQDVPRLQLDQPMKIGYHDACHLAHAQQIRQQPRQLLGKIENAELVSISESDTCCGSAGTYNLTQPTIARELGRRKAARIRESGCDVVAAGNIGCLVQIRQHLEGLSRPLPVLHTIEILDQAMK